MKYTLLLLAFIAMEAKAQSRYDIVITEIMADPSPVAGLPNYEWIELKNISAFAINLQNWRIADANGQSGPMPSFILRPDSVVIVCSNAASTVLSTFGRAIVVTSFPALDNDGDLLTLKSASGFIIHAVDYSLSWYHNELKKDGGWTLEMIDPLNPCAGYSNWSASNDPKGGTPGATNSIHSRNTDITPPQLKNVYCIDSITIMLVYNEPVDSLSGAAISNYTIENGLTIQKAITSSPLFDKVQLTLTTALQPGIIYTITASNLTDCKGNIIETKNKARFGLPADVATKDIVINEILFNPGANAFDYIELYNNSNKLLDASKLYIANRNSSGTISSIRPLTGSPYYIFPGDYPVITENAERLGLNYLVKHPEQVLTITSLPSYPDDGGNVILLDTQGEIIDEVAYKENWHFSLLDHTEGVALERINPSGPSQQAPNWHSAASTAGFGTPTYKNSQSYNPQNIDATIAIKPPVFSPDNDGLDDIAMIQYRIDEPGYVANITVFDAAGRIVKSIVRNSTMSTAGYWTWDGLNDNNQSLPIGIYIIYTELFNSAGKKKKFKNTVVLARKLN